MIPLRDTVPSSTFPTVSVILIGINAVLFLFELALGASLDPFLNQFGIIPAKYFWLGEFRPHAYVDRFMPFVSSMFLHGGWMHVIGNMWYLWIFGDNVEDRMGHGRFLAFYLLCGILSGFAHAYLNADSPVPTIGASGAIAGVMGAYFILFPHSRVLTLVPILFFVQFIEIPAFFFLGFWILLQFFQGTASLMADQSLGGVAWWAHFGGFVIGMLLQFIFRNPRRAHHSVEYSIEDDRDRW